VILAAEVEALRIKLGDKHAKIENMKNNLKLSTASNSRGK